MNNQIRLRNSKAALIALAGLLISACDGGSQPSDTEQTTNNQAAMSEDQSTEKAVISLTVKFPEPEVTPAWVGDAQSIQVRFYGTDATSWANAGALQANWLACESNEIQVPCNDISDDSLKGDLLGSIDLTTDNSTGYLNLDPGQYRVEATFLDSDSNPRETSVSYANLPSGAHSIRLSGLSAQWTLETPLAIQMLNSDAMFTLNSDWDPQVAGNQLPIDALGLTNGTVLAFSLPAASKLTLANEFSNAYGSDAALQAGLMQSATPEKDEDNQTYFVPIINQLSVGLESFTSIPSWISETETDKDATYQDAAATRVNTFTRYTEPAFLRQGYDGSTNTSELSLGGQKIEATETYTNNSTDLDVSRTGTGAELLLGVASTAAEDAYSITKLTQKTDRYWKDGGFVDSDNLVVATIKTDRDPDTSWLDVFLSLQGSATSMTDGSTIQGYLIEHAYTWATTTAGALEEGAGSPTPYLDASLNAIAKAEGLVATASADEICGSYENKTSTEFSNQYRWDEDNQQWVAGTLNTLLLEGNIMTRIDERIASLKENQAYYAPGAELENADTYDAYQSVIDLHDANFREMVLSMSDMNQDGVASLFEDGVYMRGSEPACWLIEEEDDDGYLTYQMKCLEITVADTIVSEVTEISGNICVQSFTATASLID